MFRALAIIRDNNSTFYSYRSGEPVRIRTRIVLTFIAALIASTLWQTNLDNFLSSAITVQAILIGFSFSVMFFLVTSDNLPGPNGFTSIEMKLKVKKLKTLSTEIFYNISYFNMVAVACVSLSLLLLLPSISEESSTLARVFLKAQSDNVALTSCFAVAVKVAHHFILFLFYFLLIESAYSFTRTVGRVNFLFEQKLLFAKAALADKKD